MRAIELMAQTWRQSVRPSYLMAQMQDIALLPAIGGNREATGASAAIRYAYPLSGGIGEHHAHVNVLHR